MRLGSIFIGFVLSIVAEFSVAATPVTSFLEIRQRNVVVQEWDLSCGAAALATVLRYQFGISVTEKEVATELIDRQEYIDNPNLLALKQGFSLFDLKRYVDKRGMSGNGYGQMELDDLIELGVSIVPLGLDGYNHFVVFRGIVGNRVLLADPAWGNRIVMLDRFLENWIEFGDLGRIAFSVGLDDANPELNKLLPTSLDFVMLQ